MKLILNKLFNYQNLTTDESRMLLHNIAQGKYNDTQVASLITVFLMRHIAIEELQGFRLALLELCVPVKLHQYKPIDIVGTGGDGKDTFNVSTCACFVVAAAGYPVVKHGNYGVSSVSGASNVMEKFGVKFNADNDLLLHSLDACNMAYLHAPLFNSAMKAVGGVRKNLGVRSFFNILGPLVNPAHPPYQLLGVYNLAMQRLYYYMLQQSNMQFAVIHSLDGYDEISLTNDFKVNTLTGEKIYSPADLGFSTCNEIDLYGGSTIEQAAEIFGNVLNNKATEAQRNVVLANAAFAVKVITPQKSVQECLDEVRYALESGKAMKIFRKFIEINS